MQEILFEPYNLSGFMISEWSKARKKQYNYGANGESQWKIRMWIRRCHSRKRIIPPLKNRSCLSLITGRCGVLDHMASSDHAFGSDHSEWFWVYLAVLWSCMSLGVVLHKEKRLHLKSNSKRTMREQISYMRGSGGTDPCEEIESPA